MGLGLSKATIDALGRRIANAPKPSAADLATLATLQREQARALDAVTDVLRRELGTPPRFGRAALAITSRVKTARSLLDAVGRRESVSDAADAVGIRVVGALNLHEQDALTERLLGALPDSKVIDHRRRPKRGYRAVHIVARYSGVTVEIQIRTLHQHAWAEVTERVADAWGHAILHGLRPAGRNAAEISSRAEALERWEAIADRIARLEQETMRLTDILSERIQTALRSDRALKPVDAATRLISQDPSQTNGIQAAGAEIAAALREGGLELSALVDSRP
ncbi:MAG: RelA/SpoT domain-containing protein [Chloroflexota bacterium]